MPKLSFGSVIKEAQPVKPAISVNEGITPWNVINPIKDVVPYMPMLPVDVRKCLPGKIELLPLYDFQKEGRSFLFDLNLGLQALQEKTLYPKKKRVILADDMGLGKTLQTIAAVNDYQQYLSAMQLKHLGEVDLSGMKILVITTKNAKPVWQLELRKWLNEECTIVEASEGVNTCAYKFLEPDTRFVICNFEHCRQFYNHIMAMKPSLIIVDEAHKFRNTKTQQYKGAERIFQEFKTIPVWFLTGTPLVNSPEDLWSLLHLLEPEQFTSKVAWLSAWFCKYGTQYRHCSVEAFQDYISKYMLRRLRKDVLSLPPVQYIETPIYLEGKQKLMYEQMRDAFVTSFDGKETIETVYLLAQITRLKQIALAPELITGMESCEGAKTEELEDILEDFDGKTVVTSMFGKYLRPLKTRLEGKGYRVGLITGQTNTDDRANQVAAFQAGELDVFLISTKAGGESITLTAANQFITMDKPWTSADEDQVFGRVYRNGQEQKVIRRYLKAHKTIEEYIEEVIGRKRDMFTKSVPVSLVKKLLGM